MPIPFNDLSATVKAVRPEIDAAISRVLDRGWFILGPEVDAFEEAFAHWLGVDQVIGVANGTEAIQLALMAHGIGPGDEVICPALSAAPSALAIQAAGAEPVFCDVHHDTLTLDPARLEETLSKKTRAILPVHLYGLAADMPAIMDFAGAHQLAVIEDVAQAHGATVNGIKTGNFAQTAAFSFYPTKNLGAFGDGGAVSTSDLAVAARLREYGNLGQTGRFEHRHYGLNSRLDDMQAAILGVLLEHLDSFIAARRERAGWYAEMLSELPEVTLPAEPEGHGPVYHLYVIRHPDRDALRDHLKERGIACDVQYPLPLSHQPAFKDCRVAPGGVPVTEKAVTEILSLPMYPALSRESVEEVAAAIRDFRR